MKHLVWVLVLLVVPTIGVPVAAAQDSARLGDPIRNTPLVRVSVAATYQRWTQNGTSLRELSFPLSARVQVQPNLGVQVGLSGASAEGDGLAQVSGLTDVQLGVDYLVSLNTSKLLFNLGVNVPTGTSRLTDEAFETAFQLGLSQYDFDVPHFGQGLSLAPGVAWVIPLMEKLVIGAGVAFHFRGSFEPISGLPDKYEWGDELILSGGGSVMLQETMTLSVDAAFTRYQADKVGGNDVYEAGNRLRAQVQLHKKLRRHDLGIVAQYRNVGTNQAIVGGILQDETVQAFPGFFRVSGQYRVRLNPTLRTSLHVEGTRYEEAFGFEELDVYGVGMAPELTLSPAVTLPLRIHYSFGDLEGLEAGFGVVAVL